MKLKKCKRVSLAKKRLRRIANSVRELNLDVQDIEDEHDCYRLNIPVEDIEGLFSSLPIETLNESLSLDKGSLRTSFSIQNMSRKFELQRLYEQKQEELLSKKRELVLAKVECILEEIKYIEKDI